MLDSYNLLNNLSVIPRYGIFRCPAIQGDFLKGGLDGDRPEFSTFQHKTS